MTIKTAFSVGALGVALLALTACSSTNDDEPAQPPNPADVAASAHADFDAGAAKCPDAITADQLAAAVDDASGFVLPDEDPLGRVSYAGLFPPVWDKYAHDGQDPTNLADSIDVLSSLACDSADQVRDKPELTITGGELPTATNPTLDSRLSTLTWAVVYVGTDYITQTGGVDLASPVVAPYLDTVLPGQFPVADGQ